MPVGGGWRRDLAVAWRSVIRAGRSGSVAVLNGHRDSLESELGQLRKEVLGLLGDDDVPVQAVWWAANSLFPEQALSTRLALAEELVRTLIDEGAANLYRSGWPDSDGEVVAEVVNAEVEDVLRSWSTWITSEDAVLLGIRDPV
jgi:hypothetical protein